MTTLANKIALVTGASRGMGRATALSLGAAGARVIVHYGRNADEAKAVVRPASRFDGRLEIEELGRIPVDAPATQRREPVAANTAVPARRFVKNQCARLAPQPFVSDPILCYLLWPSFELLSQRSKDHPQIA